MLRRINPIFNVFYIEPGNLPLDSREEVVVSNCLRDNNRKIISLLGHPLSITGVEGKGRLILLVDIGTTKIAYQVIDDKGNILREKIIMNPLMSYGADIITRLSKIIENSVSLSEMREKLHYTIMKIANENNVIMAAFAGNSVNQSILLGLPIDYLAVKPYQPLLRGPFIGVLGDCTPFYAAPFIGGFVGADAFSNVAAVEYMGLEKPYLIIDIGTNTEVIVGTDREEARFYVTSTPAGPAFEGHIESGAGVGFPGISSVKIREIYSDKILFDYTVEGSGKPVGLLGSGVISLLAELLRYKVIDEKGRIIKGYRRINGVKTITIVNGSETGIGRPITFSQLDIRELQKAIAAVKTSWQLLLRESNIEVSDLKWVILTGTFGSSISIDDALFLGLIPKVEKNKIMIAGNMVLSGLKTLVLDKDHEEGMRQLLKKTKNIDLAETREFMSTWIRNLDFNSVGS